MRIEIGDKLTFSNIFYKSTKCKVGVEELNGITIDSRKVQKGDIFVALKGEKFDGHDFIDDCLGKGASFVINEKHEDKNIVKVNRK